ncbi:PucC family protein [Elioraea sp.]|uniref:PucC family protein n=1 Tax=Elioraea sp. TaxID=2185103 RepID=UPI0025B900CB|nr:PucC family protein [Elioraea sp.]
MAMNRLSQKAMRAWVTAGPRFLPFADAASADLPLSRLLRLSLIQVSVGTSLVLLVGTLNRVMIVELGLSATIVAAMIALPVLFAPFRALIGYRSDTHTCVLGWRRVPFLFRGAMLQFGGLAIMPFALLVLAGEGHSDRAPAWIGQASAALAFLLVGAGLHTTQTVGLALATDLARPEQRPNVVGLMYVMLLVGMIGAALVFGFALEPFSPGRLIQVIQGTAVVTLVLNAIALWKQEARRSRTVAAATEGDPGFRAAIGLYMQGPHALARLAAVGLGTMAFGMQDVLLEPYGGEVLGMTVSETTRLTASLAGGSLAGFALASRMLSRGAEPFRMAMAGAIIGAVAFCGVLAAAPAGSTLLFVGGVMAVGFGAGLFGHGTLTATMNHAPKEQAGLALGAWGAVQASAAGLGVAIGAPIRDIGGALPSLAASLGPAAGYTLVFILEITLLLAAIATMVPLLSRSRARMPGADGSGYEQDGFDLKTR